MTLLPIHDAFALSLLEVHWAAQLPAAASHLIDDAADWSHTNLLVEGDCLRGRPLPDGRRAGLRVMDLTLVLGDDEFPLQGKHCSRGFVGWANNSELR